MNKEKFEQLKNRLDNLYKVPCYDDLYLDITYLDGYINILDEDELIAAYKSGDISQEDYELVYKMRDRLLEEINNKTNKLMNINCFKKDIIIKLGLFT